MINVYFDGLPAKHRDEVLFQEKYGLIIKITKGMMMSHTKFPYAGRSFTITMDNGLKVKNTYSENGQTIAVEFMSGDLTGTRMEMPFAWRQLSPHCFLISWQENDKSTVVHCDDFEMKKSYAYYTTMKSDFFVMEGNIA